MNAEEIVSRIKLHWRLKIILSMSIPVGFWSTYLFIQRHPLFRVMELKTSQVDDFIPFLPGAVYLYESLWLLLPIAPWLMRSKEELRRYAASLLFICIVGFTVFVFFPTSSPRPHNIEGANLLYRTLISVDNELNAFPSLHTALSILSAACCAAIFRTGPQERWLRWCLWCWALGIIASTLLTKQHVVIDVAGGAVVGFGGHIVGWRSGSRSKETTPS